MREVTHSGRLMEETEREELSLVTRLRRNWEDDDSEEKASHCVRELFWRGRGAHWWNSIWSLTAVTIGGEWLEEAVYYRLRRGKEVLTGEGEGCVGELEEGQWRRGGLGGKMWRCLTCYWWGGLTCWEEESGKFWLAREDRLSCVEIPLGWPWCYFCYSVGSDSEEEGYSMLLFDIVNGVCEMKAWWYMKAGEALGEPVGERWGLTLEEAGDERVWRGWRVPVCGGLCSGKVRRWCRSLLMTDYRVMLMTDCGEDTEEAWAMIWEKVLYVMERPEELLKRLFWKCGEIDDEEWWCSNTEKVYNVLRPIIVLWDDILKEKRRRRDEMAD